MHSLNITAFIATLAALATASTSCTTTVTPDYQCCLGPAGHTTTAYVDCQGCEMATPLPNVCDLVRCASPTGVMADRTTTLTTCAASVTPSIETYVRRQEETETGCLKLATKTTAGCQDCGATAFAMTRTIGVECGGCSLQTVNVEVPGPCVCATATTVMECLTSPTIY